MTEVIKTLSQGFHHRLKHHLPFLTIEYISIFTIWLFTISSLIGIGLGQLDWFITKTPLNLMIGFLLLLINLPFDQKHCKSIFALIFVFGMLLEIVGVLRGDLFGAYYYGENLGFKVHGVPLMIGIYWAVLTFATSQIARMFSGKVANVALIGASLMVGLDFLMEQMAPIFDFWYFTEGAAPLQNYITWFLASFFLQLLVFKYISKSGGRFALHLYLNQVVFFILSYLLLGFLNF